MKYIENPIHFFRQLTMLAEGMYKYLRSRNGDINILSFPTSKVFKKHNKTMGFWRGITLEKCDFNELDDSASTLIHGTLCFYSEDQENWIFSSFSNDSRFFREVLDPDDRPDTFRFYVCDLTKTFYTIITETNIDLFMKYKNIMVMDKEGKVYIDYPECILELVVKIPSLEEKLGTISLLEVDLDRDGDPDDVEVTLIDKDEFFKFKSIDEEKYLAYEKKFKEKKSQYSKKFKDGLSIDLFGKTIEIKGDSYPSRAATFSAIYEELFSSSNPHYAKTIQAVFRKYDNFIKVEEAELCEEEIFKIYHDNIMIYARESIEIAAANEDALNLALDFYILSRSSFDILEEMIKETGIPLLSAMYLSSFGKLIEEAEREQLGKSESVDRFKERLDDEVVWDGSIASLFGNFLVKSVATTVYESYKESSMENVESAKAAEKEFMKTKESKDYMTELIDLDYRFLFMTEWIRAALALYKSEYDQLYGNFNLERIAKDYIPAALIYSKISADQKGLKFQIDYPFEEIFEEFEEEYDDREDTTDENVFYMQKVLMLWPYEPMFYEKYFEVGGKLSEELYLYAGAHMIDLTALYEREKERIKKEKEEAVRRKAEIEKQKAEEAERERIEEERRKIEEEKRRKEEEERKRIQAEKRAEQARKRKLREEEKRKAEEERKRKARERLAKEFGLLPERYPELLNLMIDNPLYYEKMDSEIANHIDLADIVFRHIAEKHPQMYLTLYSGNSSRFNSKMRNLMGVHGRNVTPQNVVLFYDNTVFGSAKDGFVITVDKLCVHNVLEKATSIPIKEIQKITFDEKNIFINDTFRVEIGSCNLPKPEFVDIFSFCVWNLLHLAENGYYVERPAETETSQPVASAGERIAGTIVEPFGPMFGKAVNSFSAPSVAIWKCTCGMDVPAENNFCQNCGAKRPEVAADWFCTACGKMNPAESKFCGQCGTKKID